MRPTRDEMLMEVAHVIARRGTCSRAKVGAVVARDGRILTTGYNGAPAGRRHCSHDGPETRGPCTISVHAEANSIAYAARYGLSLSEATLYTTMGLCLPCSQLVVNSGIVRVVSGADYRDPAGVELLSEVGIEYVRLDS